MATQEMQSALTNFFSASKYIVVGASKDPSKFGNKVLRWYQNHGLDVTPIHPKETEIEQLKTHPDVNAFLDANRQVRAEDVAISVITPPKISLSVIKEGVERQNVSTIWLQPGAEDAELVKWVKAQPKATQEKVIYGGPCILVSGADLARSKGKL